VTNDGVLRLGAPETIFGAFLQDESGALDFLLAGDALGQYGALTVTRLAALAGDLDIETTGGFSLKAGDSFDLVDGNGGIVGNFDDIFFGGAPCSATGSDVWLCRGAGFYFDLSQNGSSVNLTLLGVPEPSACVLAGVGFLGLGELALRRRERLAVA